MNCLLSSFYAEGTFLFFTYIFFTFILWAILWDADINNFLQEKKAEQENLFFFKDFIYF